MQTLIKVLSIATLITIMIFLSSMGLKIFIRIIEDPTLFINILIIIFTVLNGLYVGKTIDNILSMGQSDPEEPELFQTTRGNIRSLTELKNEPNSSTFQKIPKQ